MINCVFPMLYQVSWTAYPSVALAQRRAKPARMAISVLGDIGGSDWVLLFEFGRAQRITR
ncbi:hypothetical protein [Zhongshania marina]|uniref:hypothetical protein n=1 Tax=Zhongshania marina TaxID=2304603 RepID=UPI0011CEABB3